MGKTTIHKTQVGQFKHVLIPIYAARNLTE